MSQTKILCAYSDKAVKERCCMELTAEGYEVVGTTLIKHAAQLLAGEHFDLLIIGIHFTAKDREWLAGLAHDRYRLPTLLLWEGQQRGGSTSDGRVFSGTGGEALRKAANSLLSRTTPAQHRAAAA